MQHNIFDTIITLNDTSLTSKIKLRLEYLENTFRINRDIGYITFFNKSLPFYGYIPNNIKIRYDLDNHYYQIIKNDYIYTFIQYIKKNNIKNKNEAILHIPSFLTDYFGKKVSRLNNVHSCLLQDSKDCLNIKDIANLQNKACATSLEYSLLAQNILSFLDYDVIQVIGGYKHKDKKDFYAYNIIVMDDNYYLFDFYDTVDVFNQKGEVVFHHPFQTKLDKDKINLFLQGYEEVRVKNYKRVCNDTVFGQINIDDDRCYILGNYLF